ncbi:stage II sporulation protein R [Clostridium niameyense]|uniref:Stage II sporulation protein R n=1 Tax=Clostridium niameyense TaxID=1622073 RepID=A0A6M0RAW0_9CLOT|nr:stage II sporulation protein R [Clostridium niameyense]NEZ47405.1 stage II sporulation protein R [Clostridium niameyense]
MKKIMGIISIIVIFLIGLQFIYINNSTSVGEDISHKIIRFHVIANSDTLEDQSLKLKVKDEVIKYMMPKLKESKNINESRKILRQNDNAIKEIAFNVIKEYGYDYSVNTSLDREKFPIKTYGNITLPQGDYEAYKITIGSGEGQNWWCVMFPPLCFVDVTKGQVSDKKTEEQMKRVLNSNEYKYIDNNNKPVQVKFKIAESLK